MFHSVQNRVRLSQAPDSSSESSLASFISNLARPAGSYRTQFLPSPQQRKKQQPQSQQQGDDQNDQAQADQPSEQGLSADGEEQQHSHADQEPKQSPLPLPLSLPRFFQCPQRSLSLDPRILRKLLFERHAEPSHDDATEGDDSSPADKQPELLEDMNHPQEPPSTTEKKSSFSENKPSLHRRSSLPFVKEVREDAEADDGEAKQIREEGQTRVLPLDMEMSPRTRWEELSEQQLLHELQRREEDAARLRRMREQQERAGARESSRERRRDVSSQRDFLPRDTLTWVLLAGGAIAAAASAVGNKRRKAHLTDTQTAYCSSCPRSHSPSFASQLPPQPPHLLPGPTVALSDPRGSSVTGDGGGRSSRRSSSRHSHHHDRAYDHRHAHSRGHEGHGGRQRARGADCGADDSGESREAYLGEQYSGQGGYVGNRLAPAERGSYSERRRRGGGSSRAYKEGSATSAAAYTADAFSPSSSSAAAAAAGAGAGGAGSRARTYSLSSGQDAAAATAALAAGTAAAAAGALAAPSLPPFAPPHHILVAPGAATGGAPPVGLGLLGKDAPEFWAALPSDALAAASAMAAAAAKGKAPLFTPESSAPGAGAGPSSSLQLRTPSQTGERAAPHAPFSSPSAGVFRFTGASPSGGGGTDGTGAGSSGTPLGLLGSGVGTFSGLGASAHTSSPSSAAGLPSRREEVLRLRAQLRRRDEMILDMQTQLLRQEEGVAQRMDGLAELEHALEEQRAEKARAEARAAEAEREAEAQAEQCQALLRRLKELERGNWGRSGSGDISGGGNANAEGETGGASGGKSEEGESRAAEGVLEAQIAEAVAAAKEAAKQAAEAAAAEQYRVGKAEGSLAAQRELEIAVRRGRQLEEQLSKAEESAEKWERLAREAMAESARKEAEVAEAEARAARAAAEAERLDEECAALGAQYQAVQEQAEALENDLREMQEKAELWENRGHEAVSIVEMLEAELTVAKQQAEEAEEAKREAEEARREAADAKLEAAMAREKVADASAAMAEEAEATGARVKELEERLEESEGRARYWEVAGSEAVEQAAAAERKEAAAVAAVELAAEISLQKGRDEMRAEMQAEMGPLVQAWERKCDALQKQCETLKNRKGEVQEPEGTGAGGSGEGRSAEGKAESGEESGGESGSVVDEEGEESGKSEVVSGDEGEGSMLAPTSSSEEEGAPAPSNTPAPSLSPVLEQEVQLLQEKFASLERVYSLAEQERTVLQERNSILEQAQSESEQERAGLQQALSEREAKLQAWEKKGEEFSATAEELEEWRGRAEEAAVAAAAAEAVLLAACEQAEAAKALAAAAGAREEVEELKGQYRQLVDMQEAASEAAQAIITQQGQLIAEHEARMAELNSELDSSRVAAAAAEIKNRLEAALRQKEEIQRELVEAGAAAEEREQQVRMLQEQLRAAMQREEEIQQEVLEVKAAVERRVADAVAAGREEGMREAAAAVAEAEARATAAAEAVKVAEALAADARAEADAAKERCVVLQNELEASERRAQESARRVEEMRVKEREALEALEAAEASQEQVVAAAVRAAQAAAQAAADAAADAAAEAAGEAARQQLERERKERRKEVEAVREEAEANAAERTKEIEAAGAGAVANAVAEAVAAHEAEVAVAVAAAVAAGEEQAVEAFGKGVEAGRKEVMGEAEKESEKVREECAVLEARVRETEERLRESEKQVEESEGRVGERERRLKESERRLEESEGRLEDWRKMREAQEEALGGLVVTAAAGGVTAAVAPSKAGSRAADAEALKADAAAAGAADEPEAMEVPIGLTPQQMEDLRALLEENRQLDAAKVAAERAAELAGSERDELAGRVKELESQLAALIQQQQDAAATARQEGALRGEDSVVEGKEKDETTLKAFDGLSTRSLAGSDDSSSSEGSLGEDAVEGLTAVVAGGVGDGEGEKEVVEEEKEVVEEEKEVVEEEKERTEQVGEQQGIGEEAHEREAEVPGQKEEEKVLQQEKEDEVAHEEGASAAEAGGDLEQVVVLESYGSGVLPAVHPGVQEAGVQEAGVQEHQEESEAALRDGAVNQADAVSQDGAANQDNAVLAMKVLPVSMRLTARMGQQLSQVNRVRSDSPGEVELLRKAGEVVVITEGVIEAVGEVARTGSPATQVKLLEDIAMPSVIASSAAVEAKEVSPPSQSNDGSVKAAAAPPATWKASIDFKWVRENRDLMEANVKERQSNADVARVVELYEDFVSKNLEVDRLRAERNKVANAMKAKLEAEERARLVSEGKHLKDVLAGLESELGEVASELQREGQRLPNLTHPDVPRGGEEVAVTLRTVGEKRVFAFPPKDHVELGLALDLFDFDSAAEVSGAKFYYLRNEAALLEMALLNWALALLVARGFTPVSTPDLVRSHVVERCGFQPRAANTQVYSVEGSDLCLAGTAEIPVGGSFMDKILSESDLPQRVVAFSHCFRTEAGAAGSATRGLYRVHQFSKLEMFVVCRPEDSNAFHQELIQIEEDMYTALGLHFVKIEDKPDEVLRFADEKVDVALKYADSYVPRDLAYRASDFVRTVPVRAKEALHGYQEKGALGAAKSYYYDSLEPVLSAYLVFLWRLALSMPLVPHVVEAAYPTVFAAASKYNTVVASFQKSDFQYLKKAADVVPLVPVEKAESYVKLSLQQAGVQ
ncbi:unnamed protein product [Closterium sp. Naga37s-1]|nr:unnamed protein product [Closterium sp. Naga37s-1]